MSNSFYHKDLTDTQWNRIKCLFKEPKKVGRPSLNPRMVLNGILWILRTGARWRDLPARYGNWNSIYHKFRLWCESGFFQSLLQSVTADAAQSALLEIDSTFCKVHQSACSGLKNQAIGSSRGGKNTKVHVLINERMQLLGVVLTGGHIHDSQSALDLLAGIDLAGKKILADKAYSCQYIRDYLEEPVQSYVSRINPISIRNTNSIPTCISDAILSNASCLLYSPLIYQQSLELLRNSSVRSGHARRIYFFEGLRRGLHLQSSASCESQR